MTLAEDLKPVMEERMKIDLAPWAKAYIEEDMDKLYTELTIEKQGGYLTDCTSVKDYCELLNEKEQDKSERQIKGQNLTTRKKIGKKILCKGDPGMGKTTWVKKIGWDWATGIFTTYSIVFFVFLKLVRPGAPIENVIINQTPKLEGMNMKPEKLRSILDTFGDRCLLIVDGLDEHALGKNEDVLKIIEGRKFLYCSIIVTSRPHSTNDIEHHFPTIVRVQGFTKNRAREIALRFFQGDTDKVDSVMDFEPSRFESINNCPIILLIWCVLVRENQMNLKSKVFTEGDLYFKLTRFLYQKYASSHELSFNLNDFIKVLTQLGKLAWETLKSGNPFLQRSQVIEDVGEDAFKYGLLIGHEDFRLIGKETADILITYHHRTIEEFLGSFYFVLMLDAGQKIEKLIDVDDRNSAKFMRNPLLLHFCLFFMFSDQTEIPLENKAVTRSYFLSYVSMQLDLFSLDLEVIGLLFPAFVLDYRKDNLIITFLGQSFRGYKK